MADDDNWSESDEATYLGECDHCGERGPVQRLPDPYMSEIYPGEPEEITAWCRSCWLVQCDEI